MRQSCSGAPVKAGTVTSSASAVAAERAVGAGEGDLEIGRAGIAPAPATGVIVHF